jgi:archaellum component FlaC
MTDSEIIKALENAKAVVDHNDIEVIEFFEQAIDLISRQKADLDLMAMDIDSLIREKDELFGMVEEQKAEIERLRNAYKQCAWERDVFSEDINAVKSEAVKEFADKLIEKAYINNYCDMVVSVESINALVQEMVGEKE